MSATGPISLWTGRFSMRLPRLQWLGFTAVALLAASAGFSWYLFRRGPIYERAGIKYSLDLERALALAKLLKKPVFVYFTMTTCVNGRRMENGLLSAPQVTERLDKFVCAAAFLDRVPYLDAKEESRLLGQNLKVNEALSDVTLPAFVVIPPDFDLAGESGPHKLLAVQFGMTDDMEMFTRFIDDSLDAWTGVQQPEM